LAELARISASTISRIECHRNETALLVSGKLSRTHVEVVMRLAVALGYMQYGEYLTIEEVAKLQKLFRRHEITDRGRGPTKLYHKLTLVA
jgi:hypothetical protein